ncbi:hypothetical protein, partial [Roseibium sp. RKSG952]|uniref:hypothetical protein n=1 Tax=Roseibium sp. RKSG952 TaxID=2529384 RepID=UPI0012BBAF0D
MIKDKYSKNKDIVKNMAARIAANGPQTFQTDADFAQSYGQDAVDMVSKGGLLAALHIPEHVTT